MWKQPEQLENDITPERVRDLLVDCFYEAQKETMKRLRTSIGHNEPTDIEMKKTIEAGIRSIFSETRNDFYAPTKQGLKQVIEALGYKAASWGTPKDIVNHHYGQMVSIIEKLN